jgi:hypothetical protein
MAISDQQRRARVQPSAFYLPLAVGLSAVLAALAAYSIACIRFAHLGADQSWLLYAASRVLAGYTLDGPRIVESNPPLIVWFSALPDLLASWLHAPTLFILKVMVIAMTVASAAWSVRLLRAAKVITTLPLLCLSFFAITAVEVSRDLITLGQFSEREQLVVLLALPYLLYCACGSTLKVKTAERVALGIAAGFGVCLKPQEVLILITFELFLLLWTRNVRLLLRPELLSAALAICVYVLIVFIATPYFSTIIPVLRDTYWAFADASKFSLARIAFLNAKFLVALLLAIGVRRYLKYPSAPLALLAASLGAGLAYIQQGMDWGYHLLPATVLFLFALGFIALDLLSSHLSSLPATTQRHPIALAALTLILFAVSLPRFFARERHQVELAEQYRSHLYTLVRQFPPQTPFYVFTTCNGEFFLDVIQHHLVWTSRYNHLWMLPAIVENERASAGGPPARKHLSPARVAGLATELRSNITEDLRGGRPAFVVVEHCNLSTPCLGLGNSTFDMLQWFLKSPTFAAEWSHYQPHSTERYFDVYTRKPSN